MVNTFLKTNLIDPDHAKSWPNHLIIPTQLYLSSTRRTRIFNRTPAMTRLAAIVSNSARSVTFSADFGIVSLTVLTTAAIAIISIK